MRDLGRIGQRRGEPLRQKPCAGRGPRAVDGGEQLLGGGLITIPASRSLPVLAA